MSKAKKECDVANGPNELVKRFKDYCDICERNCPMGCIRRKTDILQCFAEFCMSRVRGT